MKQKKWFKSAFLLAAAVLFAAWFFVLIFRYDNKYTARASISQEGVTILSKKDLSDCTFLADGWELYPDALFTPTQLQAQKAPLNTFVGEYLNLAPLHADRSPYGSATWRLRLCYDGPEINCTLLLPEVFCAFKLYVNGEELTSQGLLEPYQPHVQDTLATFALLPETELVVQTANYSHYYGGLTYPPVLGTAQSVGLLVGTRLLFYSFLSFGALVAALFSAALWLGTLHTQGEKKSRDRISLLFGVLALAFAVWVSYPFSRFLGIPLLKTLYAAEDAAALLIIWCALRITLRLCNASRAKWAQLCSRIALAIIVVGVLTPLFVLPIFPAFSALYGKLITGYKLLAALTLVGLALYGCMRGKKDVGWLLCGTAFYGVGLLAGTITVSSFEPARFGWTEEYGAFALVVCFGILMVRRSYVMLQENRRLNVHLHDEVAKKTEELGLMVNEREDLISKFLHDMKSPAAFMLSYAKMVRQNNVRLDDETREQLAIIEEKCSAITDRVLQVQQFTIENPLITTHKELELCSFLQEFYYFNKPDVEMDGQNFLLRLPKSPCKVLADCDKLNRLLQNLIYNAVSFTEPEDEIWLSLTCDDEWALLCVEDGGHGIEPEVLPHIFDRFYTTRTNDGGTGMGLYIVSAIAREHGGEVIVKSRLGEGTAFTIRLPLL